MKRFTKIIALLIFAGALVLCIQSLLAVGQQDTTKSPEPVQQETYVPQMIIDAPWGEKNQVYDKEESKPGEFGLSKGEGPPRGPSSFTVAPNGDVYIIDIMNLRTQRFSSEGNFISIIPNAWGVDLCVDKNDNVYLLCEHGKAKHYVRKYDPAGNLIKEYPVFEDLGMVIGNTARIYLDDSGRLFVSCRRYFEDFDIIFQIGTTTQELSPGEQKASLRRGVFGENPDIRNGAQFYQTGGGNLYLVDVRGDTLKRSRLKESFLGADAEGKIYTCRWYSESKTYIIRKYDSVGKLLSAIKWMPKLYTGYNMLKYEMIDGRGNVYVYSSTKDKFTITKWYKK